MKLLTTPIINQLVKNGQLQAPVRGTEKEHDFVPVVKLFNPAGAGTWLLTEIEPDQPDIAWGLCDLGVGCPEFGTVSLEELRTVRGAFGLGIERDRHWTAQGRISQYIEAADKAGHIVQLPDPVSVLADASSNIEGC